MLNKKPHLRNPFTVLGVGLSVLVIELMVHFALEPYETVAYFFAIFVVAMLSWVIVAGLPKPVAILVGGLVFAILKMGYYVIAYYVGSPLLSCCLINPIHVIGVNPDVVLFTFGYYKVTTSVLLEGGPIHYLVFVLGAFIATIKAPR